MCGIPHYDEEGNWIELVDDGKGYYVSFGWKYREITKYNEEGKPYKAYVPVLYTEKIFRDGTREDLHIG